MKKFHAGAMTDADDRWRSPVAVLMALMASMASMAFHGVPWRSMASMASTRDTTIWGARWTGRFAGTISARIG
ncbi:hypothetical protein [Methylocystis hirsuta]|uniref:hypothetical protein n=1 Tax=Methylocystis hirsuta TaxID=369798 RepID=UPI0011CE02D9|nr:hypothetical protein [Methylocystis hirsuta]